MKNLTDDFYFLFLHKKINGLKDLKKGKTLHANNSESKNKFVDKHLALQISIMTSTLSRLNKNFC